MYTLIYFLLVKLYGNHRKHVDNFNSTRFRIPHIKQSVCIVSFHLIFASEVLQISL